MKKCQKHMDCSINKDGGHVSNLAVVGKNAQVHGVVGKGAKVYGVVERGAYVNGYVGRGAEVHGFVGYGAVVYGVIGRGAEVHGFVGYGAEVNGYVGRGAQIYGYVGECAKVYGFVEKGAIVLINQDSDEDTMIGKGDLRRYWRPALKLLWSCKAYNAILGWHRKGHCWNRIRKEFRKLPTDQQDEIIETLKKAEEALGITGYLDELKKGGEK